MGQNFILNLSRWQYQNYELMQAKMWESGITLLITTAVLLSHCIRCLLEMHE